MILYNDQWDQRFQRNIVRYLGRTSLDHRVLLMKSQSDQDSKQSYFKFLNFWVDQPGFFDLVQET